MKIASVMIAAVAAFGLSLTANAAAPCKDSKGKFIKCPPAAAATAKPTPKATAKPAAKPAAKATGKTQRCRDAKGRFAKCGTPGSKPA